MALFTKAIKDMAYRARLRKKGSIYTLEVLQDNKVVFEIEGTPLPIETAQAFIYRLKKQIPDIYGGDTI